MSPEFGATSTLFPIDDETLAYLRLTGRSAERVALVERYAKEQGLWREPGDGARLRRAARARPRDRRAVGRRTAPAAGPRAADGAARQLPDELPGRARGLADARADEPVEGGRRGGLGRVVPGLRRAVVRAGEPTTSRRPRPTPSSPAAARSIGGPTGRSRSRSTGSAATIRTGSVAIAAITSCTNTSNPTVMVGAGLLARNAVARGLRVGPTVKTSLAPGSRAVTGYLEAAGLMAPLEALGFALAGYGCTTCIGNSGPLDEAVAAAVEANDLVVAAVLSGNRNFEGRIHPLARASYLASPPLVVAFALAGRVDIDLTTEPLGIGTDGAPGLPRRHLALARRDPVGHRATRSTRSCSAGPTRPSSRATTAGGRCRSRRATATPGTRARPTSPSRRSSTGLGRDPRAVGDIVGARVLAVLGDSVTTDHISPGRLDRALRRPPGSGSRRTASAPLEFNSYGARRGHHEVMMRGTFAQHPAAQPAGRGQGRPVHGPPADGERGLHLRRRDALRRRKACRCVVIAGREYGSGSSRDWAAKGPALLGVRVVIAESYERIHRSNLVGMGVLPLQFQPGESAASLGLTGRETYAVAGLGRA